MIKKKKFKLRPFEHPCPKGDNSATLSILRKIADLFGKAV